MKKFILSAAILLLSLTAVNVWFSQSTPPQSDQILPITEAQQPPPNIGGAFTLTDSSGKITNDTDYRGKMMVVFFGFTHCPDICPVTSKTLSDVLTQLGDQSAQVAPLFITVDPERDTPEVLRSYFGNIDPRIIGLTGTQQQIKDVTAAYKAFFSKSEDDEELPGDGQEHYQHGKDDYTVDHSGYIYLMGKDGVYVKHYSFDAPATEIVSDIKQYLQKKP